MKNYPTRLLHRAVEAQKENIRASLLNMGYFKTPDGKQLYELTLSELEQIYENEKRRSEL